jgi:hypothetical protein
VSGNVVFYEEERSSSGLRTVTLPRKKLYFGVRYLVY